LTHYGPLFDPPPPKADKLQAAWNACKLQHPDFLDRCYALCQRAKQRGIRRWSADALFHVLRWETADTTGDHDLKINNNYSSLAARDLMARHPDLDGFFELRIRKPRGIDGQLH
jgi:hypothetical protein